MTLKLVPKRRFCGQRINGQEAQETIIDIPFSPTIGGTCLEYSKSEEKTVDITWKEGEVKVLYMDLRGNAGTEWPFPNAFWIELYLYVNDQLVVSRRWNSFEGVKSWDTNVAAHIKNGRNTFRVEMSKPGCNAWIKGLNVHVAFGSNVIPKIHYPPPEWVTYLTYGAVGLGILGAVYLGIRAYEARKKG